MFTTNIATTRETGQTAGNNTCSSVQSLRFNLSDSEFSGSLSSLDFFNPSIHLYPTTITRTDSSQAPLETPMELYEGSNPAYVTNSSKPFLNSQTCTHARATAKKLLYKAGTQVEKKSRKNLVRLRQAKQKIKTDIKMVMVKVSKGHSRKTAADTKDVKSGLIVTTPDPSIAPGNAAA